MQVVPLAQLPSQTLQIQLASQNVQLNVYQKLYGVFVDISLNGTVLLTGIIGENFNRLIRDAYFGFQGDFCFIDTEGTDNPDYTGFGTRWFLVYLSTADLASAGFAA